MPNATDTTIQPDTAAPATEAEAKAIDTAVEAITKPALTEDDAILSAIRGEEPKREGEDTPADDAKPDDAAAQQGKDADTDKGGKPAEAKPETSVLDEETPKDYKGRTRDNFERLRAEGIAHRQKAQELESKLTELAPNLEREANFSNLLADSGGTPEDIGTSIALIRAVNKGTAQEKTAALQIVEALRGILADQLGKPIDGVDYLADYPDLRKKVDDNDLDEADAREIAVLRRKTKVDGETQAQLLARQQKDADARTAQATELTSRQGAADAVKTAAEQYLARDGQAAYQVRVTYAQQTFARINAHTPVPPDKIPALFRELYESPESQLLVDATAARKAPAAGVRPVMGNTRGGTGSAVPEAQSEEDAVRLALRGG